MFLSAIQSIRFASQYRITNYFAEVIRHSSYEHEVGGIRNLEATIEDLPTLTLVIVEVCCDVGPKTRNLTTVTIEAFEQIGSLGPLLARRRVKK